MKEKEKIELLKERIKTKIKVNYEISGEWFERDKLVTNDLLNENDALEFVLMLIEEIFN